jgi:hypothetical protein
MGAPFDATSSLPEIPVIDLGSAGPVELARRARPQALALLSAARRQFTAIGVALADRQARRWLARVDNPYLPEIDAIAAALGERGIHGLNLSYEWGCTTGAAEAPDGTGMRLRRTLDWPFHGLGRNLVVARQVSPVGSWYNVTWPGLAGVYTAVAPGRFAAAINQAPLRRHTGFLPADWLVDRLRVGRSRALPPCHLLRRVFDECAGYTEARDALAETPLCLPALFTLAGTRAGEGCVIERTEDRAILHPAPAAVANQWLGTEFGSARDRGFDSPERQRQMAAGLTEGGDLDWLAPPVLNPYTRLALAANAAAGTLSVQGWEKDGPATRILRLSGLAA